MISKLQGEKAPIKSILNSAEIILFTLPEVDFIRDNVCPTDQHLLQRMIASVGALPVCRVAHELAGDFLKGNYVWHECEHIHAYSECHVGYIYLVYICRGERSICVTFHIIKQVVLLFVKHFLCFSCFSAKAGKVSRKKM